MKPSEGLKCDVCHIVLGPHLSELPLEEQRLAIGITALKVLGATRFLALLEQAVAGGTEALEWAAPEQLGVTTVRRHMVADGCSRGPALGQAHATQGLDGQLV